MKAKRKVEVFSAGCPACDETVQLINTLVCESCEVSVLDMNDPKIAARAKALGVRSVPAVAINGQLADCCDKRGPDAQTLRTAAIGQPL